MKKFLIITLCLLGWATLIVRLYLRITTSDFSVLESTIQFFSYFTILTNLLVTIYCTAHLLKPKISSNSIFAKAESLLALTVYILIVGIVYHIALKPIWNPEGFVMVLSEIHHTIVPLGTLLLWTISDDKQQMHLKKLVTYLSYPIIYITFVLIRGSFVNFYPYPFLNVNEIGLKNVLFNSLVLLLVMVVFLFLFYFIGKKMSRLKF